MWGRPGTNIVVEAWYKQCGGRPDTNVIGEAWYKRCGGGLVQTMWGRPGTNSVAEAWYKHCGGGLIQTLWGRPGTNVVGEAWYKQCGGGLIQTLWGALLRAYFNVYSTMFEHKHSQIVVAGGIQTSIQKIHPMITNKKCIQL